MVFITYNSGSFLDISFPRLVCVACLLPISALLFCEAWSVLMEFEKTTATTCHHSQRPWNFLPSISEATGSFSPQRYVWRIFIGLHVTPRFAMAAGYFKMNSELFPPSGTTLLWHNLSIIDLFVHVVEIFCLVGLSFVSSTDNYAIHEKCFYGFIICSHLHMIFTYIFFTKGREVVNYSLSYKERRSLRLKKYLIASSFVLIMAALYFFKRHELYCEDYVYSMFAVVEIGVVLCNIGFHGTAMYDFSHCYLSLMDGVVR